MKKHGTITAGGIAFTVYSGTSAERDALGSAYGYCDHERQEIWIRADLSETMRTDTHLHEALHAVYTHSGASQYVKQQLKDGVDADAFEETLVQILTPHLLIALAGLKALKP